MTEYEFTLKFRLPDADADPGQYIDVLAAAGCDDAAIGIGQRGRIALDFAREASSAFEAIASAMRAVRKAIPGGILIEASPDLVGLTEVADRVGCSRQNVRKLMVSNIATFPVAIHEGNPSLWHLHPVLNWFQTTEKRAVGQPLIEVTAVTMKLNIAKEARRLHGTRLPKELDSLFA